MDDKSAPDAIRARTAQVLARAPRAIIDGRISSALVVSFLPTLII